MKKITVEPLKYNESNKIQSQTKKYKKKITVEFFKIQIAMLLTKLLQMNQILALNDP